MTVIITILLTIRVFPHLIVVLFVMTKLSIEVFDYMKMYLHETVHWHEKVHWHDKAFLLLLLLSSFSIIKSLY